MQSEPPHEIVHDPDSFIGQVVALTNKEELSLRDAPPQDRAHFLASLEPAALERRKRGLLPGDPDPESARVGTMTPEELEEMKAVPGEDRERWLAARGLKGQGFRSPVGEPTGIEPVPMPQPEEPPAPDATPEEVGAYRERRTARMLALQIVADLRKRFTYHPPVVGQPERYEEIRGKARELALRLSVLCPPSRELSLAWTKLEEVVMWANASIARSGGDKIELPHVQVKAEDTATRG